MKILKERILSNGESINGGVLKVDSFLNHSIDASLMMEIAKEFVRRFSGTQIDKIMTVEASGIAPAIMVGYLLNRPVLFAKKSRPCTMGGNMLTAEVFSFTKNSSYTMHINGSYLKRGEKILFIDDFLANGKAAQGIMELAAQAGAEIVGMGFIIEKGFQNGGKELRDRGIDVESLAIIESLDNGEIKFKEQ